MSGKMHRAMISISCCGIAVRLISFFFRPNKRLLSKVFGIRVQIPLNL